MPRSLKDVNRIAQIARKVVSVFDGRVLTLQQACAEIRKGDPTDLDTIKEGITTEKIRIEKQFVDGWGNFTQQLETELGEEFEPELLLGAVKALLEGPQDVHDFIESLFSKTKHLGVARLTRRQLGRFNADAGAHPFHMEPLGTTISLTVSGKTISSVLRQTYNLGEDVSDERDYWK
jgi:hypothetical protein